MAGEQEDDMQAKRMRVLEETRDIDADSSGSEEDSSGDERLIEYTSIYCRRRWSDSV